MVQRRAVSARIREILREHAGGLSVSRIAKLAGVNRNTAARYLEKLLLSGQVEMRQLGMAKIYTLSQRLPQSAVLSMSSEYVMQLDTGLRVIFANDPFLHLLGATEKDLFGKQLQFTPVAQVFEHVWPDLAGHLTDGVSGSEWAGELDLPPLGRLFSCRIAPTVFDTGTRGVTLILEDITEQRIALDALADREARLHSIVQIAPVGIGIVVHRIFVYVNDRLCQMTGYSRGELIGQSAHMVYAGMREFEHAGRTISDMIKRTGLGTVESTWQRKNGSLIHVLLNSTPLNPSDLVAGITFTALDITERKRAEQALQESEEKFRMLFDNADDMITLHGMSEEGLPGRFIEVNRAGCARLGYTREELLGMSPSDILAPECIRQVRPNAEALLKDRHATFEMIHVAKNGRKIDEEISAHLFEFRGQKMVLALVRDITQRKRAEAVMREREETYRTLFENTGTATTLIDADTTIILANAEFEHLSGYTRQEIEGRMHWTDFVVPDDLKWMLKQHHLRRKDAKRALKHYEFRFVTRFREVRNIFMIIDVIPGTTRSIASLSDITERKRAGQSLQESEERYRRLIEASFDAVVIHKNGKVILANERSASVLGASSPQEIIGRDILDFVHERSKKDVIRRVKKMQSSKLTSVPVLEETFVRLDGVPVNVEVMAISFQDKGEFAIQVVFRDISRSREMETALAESVRQFRRLASQAQEGRNGSPI
jgi:PAS domain S-box-containing protein